MALAALVDGVSFVAASTGTGDFVFGNARASFLTLAQANTAGTLADGQVVTYLAQDSLSAPTQREWGHGTYSLGSNKIARTTVVGSVNGGVAGSGTPINFTTAPIVSLTLLQEDLLIGAPGTAASTAGQHMYIYAGAASGAGTSGQVRLVGGGAGVRPINITTSPAASGFLYGQYSSGRGGFCKFHSGNSTSTHGGNMQFIGGNATGGSGFGGAVGFYGGNSTNSYGGNVLLYGGNGGGSTAGGKIQLYGGNGTSSTASGGVVHIKSGSGGSAAAGGNLYILGGHSYAAFGGGFVRVRGGLAGATGNGGDIQLYCSNGGATSGNGGNVKLFGGAGGPTGAGGDAQLYSGNGGATSGNSGNIRLKIGTVVSGTKGNIIMTGLPTSSAGLPSGAVWNNLGVLNIV